MKKGDIVKKRIFCKDQSDSTEFHVQVGPYMRIEYIEENRLYCGVLNSDTPNVMLLKNRAITVSHQCLQIPDKKLRELVEKQAKGTEFQTLTHPLTKTWIKAYKDTPKIIKLYSNKGNEFYFKLLSIGITRNLRENVVKIILQKL